MSDDTQPYGAHPATWERVRGDFLDALANAARPRTCLHILETEYDAGTAEQPGGGYVPVMVIEGQSGYYPMRGNGTGAQPWYWGHDLAKARAICAAANARLGLSAEDVEAIVLSSMFAGPAASPDRREF